MKRNRGWSRQVGVRKLKEAEFFFGHFRDTEINEHAAYFLSALLSAGRSLLGAFEKRHKDAYSSWRANRSQEDRTLLNFMTAERDNEVHEAGARRGVTICVPTIHVDLRTGRQYNSREGTGFVTLEYYGKVVPAIPVCERYVELLREALDAVCPEPTLAAESGAARV